jgi:hypothetical protein
MAAIAGVPAWKVVGLGLHPMNAEDPTQDDGLFLSLGCSKASYFLTV